MKNNLNGVFGASSRTKVLVPDSAHGTNPASAATPTTPYFLRQPRVGALYDWSGVAARELGELARGKDNISLHTLDVSKDQSVRALARGRASENAVPSARFWLPCVPMPKRSPGSVRPPPLRADARDEIEGGVLELEDLALSPQTPPEVADELRSYIPELTRLSEAVTHYIDTARGQREGQRNTNSDRRDGNICLR